MLEVIWCYVCVMLYLLARQRNELIRRGRPMKGVIRSILDLSESMNRDSPGVNSWHNEKQLMEDLRGCESVGYAIWDDGSSVTRVGLVPFSGGALRKRKLGVEESAPEPK